MGWLRRFWRGRRGAVAMTAALSLPAIMGFAAFAVDLGSVFLQTRALQGVADLAAISAAQNLTNAQAAANATANANGWNGPVTTTVVLGTYSSDASLPAASRFTAGGAAPNAVQVTLSAKANLFFGQMILGSSGATINRTATAASAQLASFSIGSQLASVQGGVANAVLGGLTGSQVSLGVADYNALATANVDLLQYSQALQTNAKLKGATFNAVLSGNMSQSGALGVLADLMVQKGQTQAGQAMQQIANAASTSTPAQLNQVIDLGPYGVQDHDEANSGSGISVNALTLATAMLALAQGGREVQLNLGAAVPGLTSTTAWLAIGQRPANSPWLTVTDDNSVIIRTAQARLYVDSQIAPGALSAFGVAGVNAPVYVELASAQARLSSLTCSSGSTPEQVTLSVDPSVGTVTFGAVNPASLSNFGAAPATTPATLIGTPLVTATGYAQTNLGGDDWQSVPFSASDIQAGTMKSVSTNNVAQASVVSLVSNLNINVQVLGFSLGLNNAAITSGLQSSLSGAAGGLDSVVNTATALLGAKVGTANVWVNGVRCNDAALVG
jgi:uncharacterized membrane protein